MYGTNPDYYGFFLSGVFLQRLVPIEKLEIQIL
jgi:hypothetical protein